MNERILFFEDLDRFQRTAFYLITFFLNFPQLFIVAPGDVPTPSWEHFCVHMYINYDTAS